MRSADEGSTILYTVRQPTRPHPLSRPHELSFSVSLANTVGASTISVNVLGGGIQWLIVTATSRARICLHVHSDTTKQGDDSESTEDTC
jgi:hypothetical protein